MEKLKNILGKLNEVCLEGSVKNKDGPHKKYNRQGSVTAVVCDRGSRGEGL